MAIKPDDSELLLAWMANETLDPAERSQVEQFLADHPEQQDELEFLRSLREGVKQESQGSPGAFGLRRLQNEIRAERSAVDERKTPPAANDNRWWKMSLAAAVMVAVVQGGVLLNIDSATDDRVVPLSSGEPEEAVVQVEFHPAAPEQRIREVLTSLNARIVDGPSALGLYRLSIDQDESGNPGVDAVIDQLRAAAEVVKYAEKN